MNRRSTYRPALIRPRRPIPVYGITVACLVMVLVALGFIGAALTAGIAG